MPALPPLRLDPVLVPKPWGGRRLAEFGKDLPAGRMIGESWDVADLSDAAGSGVDDPHSRVAGGPFAGATLRDLIREFGVALLGSAASTADGGFPLLVKLLDAREHLSVQVHPHAGYVERHPSARLKTESWYVIDATPDAELFLDVVPGTSLDDLRPALGTRAVVDLLRRMPATSGDFHHLPAGLIHALGAGVLVAEVQTPSDTTFRIYDWNDEYGRPQRDLHLTEAAETVVVSPPGAIARTRRDAPGVRPLIATAQYWIREHVSGGGRLQLLPRPEVRVLMVTRGRMVVDDVQVVAGTTVVVPAAAVAGTVVVADEAAGVLEVGATRVDESELAVSQA